MFGLEREHEVAVVELGTSLPGEIACLTAVARPDVAVLTRISLEHSEGLGDIDSIQREEGAVLRGLANDAGAVVNADDPRCLAELESSGLERRWLYGQREAPSGADRYCRITACRASPSGRTEVVLSLGEARFEVESPLVGLPGAYALAASLLAAEALLGRPVTRGEVAAALASPRLGEPGRLRLVSLADGTLVVDDSYNSSPASARSSIRVARELAEQRGGRLLLALGEMRELGSLSRREHEALAGEVVAAKPAAVFAFGGDAHWLVRGMAAHEAGAGVAAKFYEDPLEAGRSLLRAARSGDVVLVKSSRGLRAERIVALLVESVGRAT